jgi:MerR family transcriptional regulator, light-induced transcriptional regulator
MVTEIYRLLELSETPRYNIKAVVQQTNVNISTLRAWELRYGVPHPNRSEHGHRLYSERDIAVVKWLKQCTDEGLAISQAVAMLDEMNTLQKAEPSTPAPVAHGWVELREQLLDALIAVDLRQAHMLVNTVCTMYPLNTVVMELFCPILVEIGERWASGTVCVAEERLVTNFIRQRLLSLIQLHAPFAQGPRLICACAPGEHHEVGLLTFALLMEQRGWEVIYLGTSISSEGLNEFLLRLSPALISFSVSLVEHVTDMLHVCEQVVTLKNRGLEMCYGGRVFSQYPELQKRFPGTFLGNDLPRAVELADSLGESIDSERWNNSSRVTYRTNGVAHLTTFRGRRAHGA